MKCNQIAINKALSQCIYDPYIQSRLSQHLKKHYSDSKCYQFYLYSSPDKKHNILLMKAMLLLPLGSQAKSVHIVIYFVKGYPDEPPLLYIEKKPHTAFTPFCSFYLNKATSRIHYELFFNWKSRFESLKDLLNEVKKLFSLNYPLIAIEGKENAQKTVQLLGIEVTLGSKNKEEDEEDNDIGRVMTFQDYHRRVNTEANLDNEVNESKLKPNRRFNGLIELNNDDNREKQALIRAIMKKTKDKIKQRTEQNMKIYGKLEASISYLNDKITQMKKAITKEEEIMTIVNQYNSEAWNYAFQPKLDRNMSNLDTVIEITNKPLLLLYSKTNTLEHYLIIIRKTFENSSIDLSEALRECRSSSLLLFKLQHKIAHLLSRGNDSN